MIITNKTSNLVTPVNSLLIIEYKKYEQESAMSIQKDK